MKIQSLALRLLLVADFMTVGTVTFEAGRMTTLEVVEGNFGGVSEVRGMLEILPDGTVKVKAEHKKDGAWQPGRETLYREDSAARVVFR